MFKTHVPTNRSARLLVVVAVLAALSLFAGCGGGSGSTAVGPAAPGTTQVQFRVGDAPADSVISFEVSLASPITLHPAGGSAAVTVALGKNRFELTHMAGDMEPLAVMGVPAGTYSSIDVTVTNPEVVFVNSSGVTQKLEGKASTPIKITLNPAITIGANASVVDFDFNVANSLTFDAQGNVTGFSFTGSSVTVAASAVGKDGDEDDDDGEFENIVGTVTNVSGSNFTLMVSQTGMPLTFTTDGNTEFKDGASSSLATLMNTIVKVEGETKADGTLYAKEVEGVEDENGAEIEGQITKVTGNPATSLTLVAHDGMGQGMDDTMAGSMFTVDVSKVQAGKYRIDNGGADFSGLSVPGPMFPFDATTIHAGQNVEVESGEGMATAGTFTAEGVKLQQQSITGMVTAVSSSSAPRTITITLPADSAIAMLSGGGTLSITVFDQPNTDHHKINSLQVGDTVTVRGLLFFSANGTNMIARRIEGNGSNSGKH
jgi:hypothetical protein